MVSGDELICVGLRRAVTLELAKAARKALPIGEGRARLTPMAAMVRRLRRAFP
jgi:hypothetical protein